MNFYQILLKLLRSQAIPIAKSIFKAYRQTTNAGKSEADSNFFVDAFKDSHYYKPPLDQATALKILDIKIEKIDNLESKIVLERYYMMFKKNDPKIGGSIYLQNKAFSAKELLMERFPNAP